MYNSITDAKTALINSGVAEFFELEQLDMAAVYMFKTDSTPEECAQIFGVL